MSNTFAQGSFNRAENDGSNVKVVLQPGQVAHFEGEDGFLRCKTVLADRSTEVNFLVTESGEKIHCFPGSEPPPPIPPPTPPVALSKFGMFYGLTTGTGNGGPNDYAATVAVKTLPGTGRVPFPRNGPAIGIVRNDPSSFVLPDIGIYEVNFYVPIVEATGGQLQLELNGVDLAETVAANRANAIAGMHPISNSVFITTTAPGEILAVINPVGNAAALTIPPADALTHANAPNITIKRIA